MYAIVGLGNPGPRYSNTRHNVGCWVIERLVRALSSGAAGGLSFHSKFDCLYTKTAVSQEEALLVLPQRYMNRSGEALVPLVNYFKIEPAQIIVIHDDADLGIGALRIRRGGSAGGHHGVEDVIGQLGSEDFIRVRIGIGRSQHPEITSWVLGEPSREERAVLEEACDLAAQSVPVIVERGVQAAQAKFNRRSPGGEEEQGGE